METARLTRVITGDEGGGSGVGSWLGVGRGVVGWEGERLWGWEE